jgi:hypothetical protein
MNLVIHSVLAVYAFLVGDIRILVGTLIGLIAAGLLARLSPVVAGGLLVVLLALTLAAALRRELPV